MTTEEKFRAAVNVIRSLPKEGSYQPSNTLMLKFYSYYKQATEGPCNIPKPYVWMIINKAKWEAWNDLGNMPKEKAMELYVEELKNIVETMSYTENVAQFMGSMNSFCEMLPSEDVDLVLGPIIDKIRSRPGSPFQETPYGSRETSPTRVSHSQSANNLKHLGSSLEVSPTSSYSQSPHLSDSDEEDEEYIDTVETAASVTKESLSLKKSHLYSNGAPSFPRENSSEPLVNGHATSWNRNSDDRGRAKEKSTPETKRKVHKSSLSEEQVLNHDVNVSAAIQNTLRKIEVDVHELMERVGKLEENHSKSKALSKHKHHYPVWWPFREFSPQTIALIILWPIIVQLFMRWVQQRRNRLIRW